MTAGDTKFNHYNRVRSLDGTNMEGKMKYGRRNETPIKVAVFVHGFVYFSYMLRYLRDIDNNQRFAECLL